MADLARRQRLYAALDSACQQGPMSFETYMDLSLYHPEGGFYTRPAMTVGIGGDFHTSVSLDPAFGLCLARHLEQVWRVSGCPETLRWLEMGPGTGELASQILHGLREIGGGWRSLECVLIERSASLRSVQERRLLPLAGQGVTVRWADSLAEVAPHGTFQGHVISNEFFDALPVRRVIGTEDGFAEIGVVRYGAGRYRQIGMVPTSPALAEALSAAGVVLRPGQQTEIGLMAQQTMCELASWFGRGTVLTIDYGDDAIRVHAPHRMKGSMRGYHRQLRIDDPMWLPGEQDLTADVDFSALARAGESRGLRALGWVDQGHFLLGLGIEAIEARRLESVEGVLARQEAAAPVRRLYRHEALGGGFKVLVQAKGLDLQAADLSGMEGARWRPRAAGWLPAWLASWL